MTSTAPTLAAANRDLLMHLARTPDPHDDTDWTREHNQRVRRVHTFIEGAQSRRETAVTLEVLYSWRVSLDTSLAHLGDDLARWDASCRPGTWLDNHLRLRALFVSLLARWDGRAMVPYADMDVPDFLWGFSPHRILLRVGGHEEALG